MDATNTDQNQQLTELEQLKQQLAQSEDKYKRLLAEKINNEKQYESQKAFATVKILEQLIDIKDDLEVILNQIPEADKESLGVMGTTMSYGKITILLLSNGVHEIEAKEGDAFDPSRNEAISTEENEEMKNKIVKILRKGYILNERVLRPVRVIVGR